MYWLSRPSYWRWAAAVLVVGASLYFELRPAASIDHPFAGADLSAGSDITTAAIDWRPVPVGVLPKTALDGFLLVDVEMGQPLVAAMLDSAPPMPTGWWGVSVPVPEGSLPGAAVRLVVDIRGTPRVVPGLVIRTFAEATIEGSTALVAIPEGEAGAVAAAMADSALEVLIGPRG